ncbi:MAG: hypothetical protein AAFQ87_21520 [Bacteroidota bacterium]
MDRVEPSDAAVAAAISAARVVVNSFGQYKDVIAKEIFNAKSTGLVSDQKTLRSYHTSLRSHDAFEILLIIWKESPFVTVDACAVAGVTKTLDGKALTQSWLSRELCPNGPDDSFNVGPQEAARRHVGRIISAAENLGLLILDREQKRDVPIFCTPKLHDIMSRLLILASIEMDYYYGSGQ